MNIASSVAALLSGLGSGPVFVHSDPFKAARLIGGRPTRPINKDSLLTEHITLLRDIGGERGLWMPAFNYDFPRTRVFDTKADPSQLGPIPERFRCTAAAWRTPTPIFSVAGLGAEPEIPWGDNTDPFGTESVFARLAEMDGVILYYGETFYFNTIIHYSERMSGGPAYRYDKTFPGRVVTADGSSRRGSLVYHVRPTGTGLDYAWPALLNSALATGLCRRTPEYPEVLAASARGLSEFWTAEMKSDPLALLDEKSREWVAPALDELGRHFLIGDFESPEPPWVAT